MPEQPKLAIARDAVNQMVYRVNDGMYQNTRVVFYNKTWLWQPFHSTVIEPVTQTPISPKSASASSTPSLQFESDPAQRPDSLGRFGPFGGKYVPETLMPALFELERAFHQYWNDAGFQAELQGLLKDYVGRPSPLYFAARLTQHYARPDG